MKQRLPAYQDGAVTVYLGDAREVMTELAGESIDCVITSPPYWGLRDFGVAPSVWGGEPGCRHRWTEMQRGRRKDLLPSESTKRTARVGVTAHQDPAATNGGRFCVRCTAWLGSLGLEPSPELFVAHLVELFREVRRVLKPTGTVWLNLGDSFYGGSRNRRADAHGLKAKDLIGVPWRVALALQVDGWYLRSDIVWHKPNPVPEPAVDRPVRAHEFFFLLSRQPHYFYDAQAIREPAVSRPLDHPWPMPSLSGRRSDRLRDPLDLPDTQYPRRDAPRPHDRNRRSVWTIPTQPFRGSHTATFPVKLIEPCILAGTSARGCCSRCGRPWQRELEITYEAAGTANSGQQKRDPRVFEMLVRQVRHARTTGWRPTCDCGAGLSPAVVLDPFAGTGTTLAVAKSLARRAIGIELNRDYVQLIRARCAAVSNGECSPEAA